MQRIILAVALLTASTLVAKAETVFIGNVSIDAVTGGAQCTSTFAAGDFFRGVYRPRGAPLGNGGDSYFATVSTRSSVAMVVPGGDFKTGSNYASQAVGSTVSIGTGTGAITAWQQVPATIGAGTPTVKFSGTITKYFRISPCTVTFSGILLKR
jgi:hypothetical protein